MSYRRVWITLDITYREEQYGDPGFWPWAKILGWVGHIRQDQGKIHGVVKVQDLHNGKPLDVPRLGPAGDQLGLLREP